MPRNRAGRHQPPRDRPTAPPPFGRNPRTAPDGVGLDGGQKIGQKIRLPSGLPKCRPDQNDQHAVVASPSS